MMTRKATADRGTHLLKTPDSVLTPPESTQSDLMLILMTRLMAIKHSFVSNEALNQ